MTLEQFQNYWNGFLTWLPFVIAALSAVRAGLVFLEGAFAIWINRTPESRFWAVWLKIMATLDYLSVSIPRHPQAIRTFAQWDANRQRAQMGIRTTKFLSLVLAAVLVVGTQTACWFTPDQERKATDQFTRANYEVSLYIGEGLNVVNSLLDLNRISPDKAIALASGFRAANSVQVAILNESIQYLQADENGKETLVITQAGQLRLETLLLSLNSAVNSAANDPAINLDSETRARISALTLAMRPLISQMIKAIQRLKTEANAPPLRLQAGPQTQVNLRQLREQLNVNANLLAEVK